MIIIKAQLNSKYFLYLNTYSQCEVYDIGIIDAESRARIKATTVLNGKINLEKSERFIQYADVKSRVSQAIIMLTKYFENVTSESHSGNMQAHCE